MKIKNIKNITTLLILSISLGHASIATAAAAFSKGATTLGVVVGSGSAFNDDYTIFGVGAGYYVLNGLELGIDIQHWFSGDPSITKISPQVKYVFTQPTDVKPYIGVFYRTTFIEDLDDQNSYGGRAGLYFSAGRGVYIGGGVVYEKYLDCADFIDCSNTYPEILVSFSF